MISVDNVSKYYGKIKAVRGISFEVPEGAILGLLGPNGAGKTTTMRVLTCFMPPTSGTARVGGHDVLENPKEIRRILGYMPENPPVYPEMEVTAFLRFVASIKNVPKADIPGYVETAMKKVNITHMRGRVIGHLSRGYRQRVGLAQALVHNPKVLILDEPTLGLDPSQIIEIRELIKGLKGQHTIILSSHILPEVQATCEEVAIINQGKIVARDSMQRLTEGQKLLISLKANGKDQEALKNKLTQLSHIKNVLQRASDKTKVSFELYPNENSEDITEQMGEEVYKLAKKEDWVLTEISPLKTTLEEIFLRATSSDEHAHEVENG